jgi:hypothetical protein
MEALDRYSIDRAEVDCICDLCERKSLCRVIHQTREQVSLCTACYKHIDRMPDGINKRSVMSFLGKNVI